jgi:hypothetical protein
MQALVHRKRSPVEHSTLLGGTGEDQAYGLGLDPLGNIAVTGFTDSPEFPTTPGAYDESHNGDRDVFVARFSPTVSELRESTFLGGGGDDEGYGLVLDAPWDPIVCGSTTSSDFPTTPGAFDESYSGDWDVFVTKLDSPAASSADDPRDLPADFGLRLVPNPLRADARGRAEIRYGLPASGWVRLSIYDVNGREVAKLVDRPQESGSKTITWSPRGLRSRVYLLRLEAAGLVDTRKVVLLGSARASKRQ